MGMSSGTRYRGAEPKVRARWLVDAAARSARAMRDELVRSEHARIDWTTTAEMRAKARQYEQERADALLEPVLEAIYALGELKGAIPE